MALLKYFLNSETELLTKKFIDHERKPVTVRPSQSIELFDALNVA